MTDLTQARLRPLADTSPSAVVAGFIAMMTGYTSSLVLMFQAGQAAGLSSGQISSWIWALSIGMAICSIGLSLRYRTPITVAWSTPGAALLITSLSGVSYGEAIGAYITCAVLVTICGLTGSFERLVKRLPSSLAAALLAGILPSTVPAWCWGCSSPTCWPSVCHHVMRCSPHCWSVPCCPGCLACWTSAPSIWRSRFRCGPRRRSRWRRPSVSIGIPLFVVAMTSQNMPGIAVLRADGYNVPASPLISVTGIASLLLAPFGSHGVNLAAISAAICTGPHAHEDKSKRYTAAVWCGIFYGIAGIFGATLAALFAALPKELVLSIAALALFGSIINGLSIAMNEPKEREAALITFMVTASGFTLFSVGSAFWGIVAGVLTLLILNWRKA